MTHLAASIHIVSRKHIVAWWSDCAGWFDSEYYSVGSIG